MTRPAVTLAALLWVLLAGPGTADPLDLQFRVIPGGAVLEDLDRQGEMVATSAPGPIGDIHLQADSAGQHHYRLQRSHFNDMDLTVWWDDRQSWRYRGPTREAFLNASTVLPMSRNIKLNVDPADALACIEADVGNAAGETESAQVIDMEGARRRVVPLVVEGDTVLLPNGYNPPVIYLVRPKFLPHVLQIPPGALDNDSTVYPDEPVALRPAYGPFSYPKFNLSLLIILGLGAGGWWTFVRPRQQAARHQREHEHRLLSDILANRRTTRGQGGTTLRSSPGLTEDTVSTDGGTRFMLLRVLGEGGMGAVYEAVSVDPGVKQKVAIKVLLHAKWDDPVTKGRFLREVRICETLQHPAIVKVLDWGTWQQSETRLLPFMVMEMLSGRTLKQILKDNHGPLPAAEVVGWLLETLQGLKIAHAAGIIHRDIKPENLMLTDSGHVKIMDFGVAHDQAEGLTRTNAHVGTPLYMSPEHFNARKVTPASDIYSLGMVAYELLAGRTPYDETDLWAVFAKVLTEEPPPLRTFNPLVPQGLADLIMTMIARDPGARPADAVQAIAALEPFAWGKSEPQR